MKLAHIAILITGLAILAGAAVFFFYLPGRVDDQMNVVIDHPVYAISQEARSLHAEIPVADLHADTLLWARNPSQRHDRGHTDLPRLREGGVFLQVFASVTKTPSNLNYNENSADSDDITLLAIAQRWPVDTWGSLYNRARFHARRLNRLAERSGGSFIVARTSGDLRSALQAREAGGDVLVGILATEGAHPLEGELANIQRLYDEGYRVIGLQHFFDNELGGSLHGTSGAGLTEFGREAVIAMVERGLIIDVAHSSEAVVRDVLDLTDAPLVVSHTGVRSLCETPRNIPDDLMQEIADRGGLIGIGFWADVICYDTPAGVARAIAYAAETFGVEAIALGSDFDGTVTTRFDASELAALTDALIGNGMSADDIRAVMGGNAVRFFTENLPEG
ncbi:MULTISPECIES: dipeptidase [Hyphobacterium]|uniref:Dipeptidase n=1 Tax=Hyphobacterium vulgare TaxID=1736751 RepID=A0ABV6ZUJ2_9PROT